MLVSVVTVTLNPGNRLKPTIDSVTSQSSGDWEMIIQDGGSTDQSLDRIETNPGILVIQERDDGIYDAMNRALARATGDYLIFLNAGDCLDDPDLISKVGAFAGRDGQPDLIFCDYRNLTNGREVRLPDHLDTMSLFRARYCHQAIFFSRALFAELGSYDTSYSIRADLEFLYRCHASRPGVRVLRIPGCGVLYEGAGFSAQGEVRAAKAEELQRIRRHYLPGWQVVLFSLLHELTFVRLRSWWFLRK